MGNKGCYVIKTNKLINKYRHSNDDDDVYDLRICLSRFL